MADKQQPKSQEDLYEARRQAVASSTASQTSSSSSSRKRQQASTYRELPPNHPLANVSANPLHGGNRTERAPIPPSRKNPPTNQANPAPGLYFETLTESATHPVDRAQAFIKECKVPPPQTEQNDTTELSRSAYPQSYRGIAKMARDNLWKDILQRTHQDRCRSEDQPTRLVRKYYRALAEMAYGSPQKAVTEATGLWVWPEEGSEGGIKELESFADAVTIHRQWLRDLSEENTDDLQNQCSAKRSSSVPFVYRLLVASLPASADNVNSALEMLQLLRDACDISALLKARKAIMENDSESIIFKECPQSICLQLLGKHPFVVATWRVRATLQVAEVLADKLQNTEEAINVIHAACDEFVTEMNPSKVGQGYERHELWKNALCEGHRASCAGLLLFALTRYYANIGDLEAATAVHQAALQECKKMVPRNLAICYELANESLLACARGDYETAISANQQASETCKDILGRLEQTWGAYSDDSSDTTSTLQLLDTVPSEECFDAEVPTSRAAELENFHYGVFENLYVTLMNNRAVCFLHTAKLMEAMHTLEKFVQENPLRHMKNVVMQNLRTIYELAEDNTEVYEVKQKMDCVAKEYRLFHTIKSQ